MKKILYVLGVLFLSLAVINVNAMESYILEEIEEKGYYTNVKGVKIDKEFYKEIKEYYSDYDIENMNSSSYAIIFKAIFEKGYKIGGIEEKYIETTYFEKSDGTISNIENRTISEEEYIGKSTIETLESCGSGCFKTEYKTVRIVDLYNGNKVAMMLENTWLKMPKIKKFDVIALRWDSGFNITEYTGTQSVTTTKKEEYFYTKGNDHYKITSNGIGLSMNLVDAAKEINNILYIEGTCTSSTTFYGTYQHARNSNVTLAISKSYSFSSSGLGGVLYFSNKTYRGYYDAMEGVSYKHKL